MFLLKLYFVFLKIGAFSFGGGYAMLPFIEREIIFVHQWLTETEFMDILAISQTTPGPIAINAATFIGFRTLGIIGSLAATLGIVSAPFLFMSFIHLTLHRYKDTAVFTKIFSYLRPITLALILSAGYSTMQKSLVDTKSFLFFIASGLLLRFTKLHPVLVVFLFGTIGVLFGN